jgi:hypothetical protein
MKINTFLKQLLIFIILNIFDTILTYSILNENNLINELNPIFRNLFINYGILISLISVKLIGISILFLMYYKFIIENKKYIMIKTLKYINIVYIFIVLNNIYWLLQSIFII